MLKTAGVLLTMIVAAEMIFPTSVKAQAVLSGDANGDCRVDGVDFVVVFNHYGLPASGGVTVGDFNTDGKVDGVDFVVLLNHYGQVCQGTPTPTPVGPTPTTPPIGSTYRAFTADSYWNKPMPANAPIDPKNSIYIADAVNTSVSNPIYLRLSGAPDFGTSNINAWAYPIYWATASDPTYTINPSSGDTIQARIPLGATPQTGSDGGIIVYDLAGNQVVELWQARYSSTTNIWSASSTKRYILNSNGLDRAAAGNNNNLNFGHRGQPSSIRAVRLDEVRSGSINHRLECFWHATGRPNDTTPWYYWPMVGYESGKGGIAPEGLVMRIKPSVNLGTKGLSPAALIIARALQNYGCMIGDNDGGTSNSVKLERSVTGWAALDPNLKVAGLSSIPFTDYEFIQGGYNP